MTTESIITSIQTFLEKTKLLEQFHSVDFTGLFSNPWFLVPFICLIGWMVYKGMFSGLVVVVLLLAAWYASGTEYLQTLTVNGEIQIDKVLPIVFGSAIGLAIIVYLFIAKK